MQNLHKKMPMISIHRFDAYQFGESWVCLCDNEKHVFPRLGAFIAWAAIEQYKALKAGNRQTFNPLALSLN